MNAKKIAVFLAARDGGAQRSALTTVRLLHERGYDLKVVMPQVTGPFLRLVPPSVGFHDLGTRGPAGVLLGLARFLRRERPDIVLSNQHQMNTAAVIAAKLAQSPAKLVLIQRNNLSAVIADTSYSLVRIIKPFVKSLWPSADAIVGSSIGVSDDLVSNFGLPKAKVHTVYNPVVGDALFELARETVVHPWLSDKATPVILGVGNLVKHKDFATLLCAFARARNLVACRLLVLGEGPERGALLELATNLGVSEHAAFPGFESNPYKYMANANVFVLASHYEGLSRVLLEALATGVPCVSTDCPSSPREILKGGKLGALVQIGNVQAMAEAILETLQTPGAPEQRVSRAREFSERRSTDAFEQLFSTL